MPSSAASPIRLTAPIHCRSCSRRSLRDGFRRNGRTPNEPLGEDDSSLWGELVCDDDPKTPGRIATLPGRYADFFDELVDAIEGKPSSVADPGLSRETIRIIELARQSANRRGKALSLD